MRKKYFRILAPFTHIEDIKLLKNTGADELYCGYVTEELIKKWPLAFNILNRRGEGQSFENYDIFRKAVDQANKHNLPVYVTINGLYTPEQYPLLLDLVKKIEFLKGVKGIIIADLGFLLTLIKNKFKKEIHISTGGTCFNSNTADFYQNLGASRIVLPRQLTANEIGNIIEEVKSKIDFEIFIIAESCQFIDGYCTFFHSHESESKFTKDMKIKSDTFLYPLYNTEQACKGCNFYFMEELAGRRFKIFSATSHKEKKSNLKFQYNKNLSFGCRICDLYDLKKYPIRSLKIIGRGMDPKYNTKLVKLVSEALSYLTCGGISKRDYQHKCKDLFSKIIFKNKRRCTKFDCYFSPHWIKNEK
ncbi:MAG: U32 family peptidase [Candidatus Kaelpia imicola]|nr:U32 family peptidase [Candidatus Kaelpia imicola]